MESTNNFSAYDKRMQEIRDGAFCEECGRQVTEAEYCRGESACCKADVLPEEEM